MLENTQEKRIQFHFNDITLFIFDCTNFVLSFALNEGDTWDNNKI